MSDYTINLNELKQAAQEAIKEFHAGDRVVIDYSYVGIWAELGGLTGTILRTRPDGFWTFDIALDHPELLSDLSAWNSTSDGGKYVSLGCGGVFHLEEIQKNQPDIIAKLNLDLGLTLRPLCTDTPALPNVQERLNIIDKILEERSVIHQKDLDALVVIRQKYVDFLPEILAAEASKAQAHQTREVYYNLPKDQQDKAVLEDLYKKEAEANRIWWDLFNEKHQWAKKNIPELAQADASYQVTSTEFYTFEQEKLDEMDDIIHEYVGRRHADLIANGPVETDRDDFTGTPLKCQSCGWAFIVRERE